MEKFSRAEKIALGIILLIFAAIVVQVATRLDLFGIGLSGLEARTVPDLDAGANLLRQPEAILSASSQNSANESAAKLNDGNPNSFWHIELDEVGKLAWVAVDFGEGKKQTVRALAALPRADLPRQFLRQAELAGSDDGESWEKVADIVLRETPGKAVWWKWDFANDRAFRYWRLTILKGHEDGSRYNFYSLAELALFK